MRLAEPALRWDEGWSLAHASLPWADLARVASLEWHPPTFAALLRLWLVFGKSPAAIRAFSVLAGVAAVPLAYAVAAAWSESRRVAPGAPCWPRCGRCSSITARWRALTP